MGRRDSKPARRAAPAVRPTPAVEHRARRGGGALAAAAIAGTPAVTLAPLWSVLVGALFGALDLALAPPVSGPKDAAEFTLVLAFGGVAHPTGYPLYVLLGHPFVQALHAAGASWAYAANAWSAVGGGVAAGLLHALAARLVPPRAAPGRLARFTLACLATGVFALSPIWLFDAILAEVYTWHLAWVAGASLFALAAFRRLAGRDPGHAIIARGAIAWGLIVGLGLAHHLTAVVVLAPMTVALAIAVVRARQPLLPIAVLAAVAALPPLSAYAFVAWRAFHPAGFQWELLEPTWSSIVAHVRGSEYADLLGHFAPDDVQSRLLRDYCWPVLFPALALSVVAVLRARGVERLARAAFCAAAFSQTLVAFEYGVRDPSCYFEPAMALGLLAIPALGADLAGRGSPRGDALALAAVASVLGVLAVVELPEMTSTRAGTIEVDRRMRALWEKVPPGPGFLLWDHDMATTFQIYQRLEGRRPDLFAGSTMTLSWPPPRRAFARRYGFDPLAGLDPLTTARAARIPENMSRQTPLPVRIFDLEHQRLVEVPKP